MKVLRTPADRFSGLPDWPFSPEFSEVKDGSGGALRLAYYDEGPRSGRTVLLMHGEPTWSYLYRKVIGPLSANGRRVVAPDLIGFGQSDKPSERGDYTYERHVAWMSQWLVALDLKDITLFCQDWGGLIGLRLVAAFPERFAGVVISNTGLPVGEQMSEGFANWLNFSQSIPEFPTGRIVSAGTSRGLSEAEVAAYDAPFPDESFKAGARQFPTLVPITRQHASVAENIAAWAVLEAFKNPVVLAFSDGDPVTGGGDAEFIARIPGATGQPHQTLKGGHFIQEDSPEDVVRVIEGLISRAAG